MNTPTPETLKALTECMDSCHALFQIFNKQPDLPKASQFLNEFEIFHSLLLKTSDSFLVNVVNLGQDAGLVRATVEFAKQQLAAQCRAETQTKRQGEV
jgi:hypothetical protein